MWIGEGESEGEDEGEATIDPFLGPCLRSLHGVVCDFISDAARPQRKETCIQWLSPPRQQHR